MPVSAPCSPLPLAGEGTFPLSPRRWRWPSPVTRFGGGAEAPGIAGSSDMEARTGLPPKVAVQTPAYPRPGSGRPLRWRRRNSRPVDTATRRNRDRADRTQAVPWPISSTVLMFAGGHALGCASQPTRLSRLRRLCSANARRHLSGRIPMASGPAAISLDLSPPFTEGDFVRNAEHVIVD